MKEKKDSLLLAAAALAVSAVLILYGIFDSPKYNSFEARLSPRAFYEWYAANYDVANITHAVKRYMRANCPLRSFFLNELPF